MNNIQYHVGLGVTAACTKRIMEASKVLYQRYVKGIPSIFFFLGVVLPQRGRLKLQWMLIMTLLVWFKPPQKICKNFIDFMTKNCPVGSYIVLKRSYMVTGDTSLIYVGYKYNTHKVLYFVDIQDLWITKSGIFYLYSYPELFSNAYILPVGCPIYMYNLFGSVYEVYSHHKSRQYDLAL